MPMKVSLGKKTSKRCCSSSLKNPNFDFPSSGVKRVKLCRFAEARHFAFISVLVAVTSVDREFKINLPRRLGR